MQRRARAAGALTIGLANNPGTPLLEQAEIPVLLATGPEFLAGSTRMAAGTAQKIALNLLSTQTMMALGRVYQGFMVDVVPSNAKLVARAKGIVQALTGCAPAEAAALWQRAGGDLKVAVLLADGLRLDEAKARLAAAGGNLRRARADDGPLTITDGSPPAFASGRSPARASRPPHSGRGAPVVVGNEIGRPQSVRTARNANACASSASPSAPIASIGSTGAARRVREHAHQRGVVPAAAGDEPALWPAPAGARTRAPQPAR